MRQHQEVNRQLAEDLGRLRARERDLEHQRFVQAAFGQVRTAAGGREGPPTPSRTALPHEPPHGDGERLSLLTAPMQPRPCLSFLRTPFGLRSHSCPRDIYTGTCCTRYGTRLANYLPFRP